MDHVPQGARLDQANPQRLQRRQAMDSVGHGGGNSVSRGRSAAYDSGAFVGGQSRSEGLSMHALWVGLLAIGMGVVRGEVDYRPGSSESAVPEAFRLAPARFGYDLEVLRETPAYTVSALRFPSPVETPDPE